MAEQYANQALSRMGGVAVGAAPVPIPTLAMRLERATQTVTAQCNRIEEVLGRINGTPPANRAVESLGKITAQTTAPVSYSVDALEQQASRLCELAGNLEQVA